MKKLLVAMFAAASLQAGLVVLENGTFEDGLDGWTVWEGTQGMFTISPAITSTPVENVDGVNVGNVTKVVLTRITRTETRTIVNGVQVGDVVVQTRSVERDITAHIRANELTDLGFFRLNFNPDKFTKPAQLWRRTDPESPE